MKRLKSITRRGSRLWIPSPSADSPSRSFKVGVMLLSLSTAVRHAHEKFFAPFQEISCLFRSAFPAPPFLRLHFCHAPIVPAHGTCCRCSLVCDRCAIVHGNYQRYFQSLHLMNEECNGTVCSCHSTGFAAGCTSPYSCCFYHTSRRQTWKQNSGEQR